MAVMQIGFKVNASQIKRDSEHIVISNMVPIVDDVVMNEILYPADEINKGYLSLNGVPAPAGHPKDANGNAISAKTGEAIAKYWIGAYCQNARKVEDRVVMDCVINLAHAEASETGRKFIERLTNTKEPISVSTGLILNRTKASGKSRGKPYKWVASNMQFDHVAILLDETPAATPEEGVGLWINSQGEKEEIEVATFNEAELANDKRKGLIVWINRLLGNSEKSFYEISSKLNELINGDSSSGYNYVIDVWADSFVYQAESGDFFKQAYGIDLNDVVSLVGAPVKVTKSVEYEPVDESPTQEINQMKEIIINMLTAAGIATEGKSDAELLAQYNELTVKPVKDQLTQIADKLATEEAAKVAANKAAINALAVKIHARGSALTVNELELLSFERLTELDKAAAPIALGNSQTLQTNADYNTLPE